MKYPNSNDKNSMVRAASSHQQGEITIENKGIIYHNINTSKLQSGVYIYNIKTETIFYKGTIIKIN